MRVTPCAPIPSTSSAVLQGYIPDDVDSGQGDSELHTLQNADNSWSPGRGVSGCMEQDCSSSSSKLPFTLRRLDKKKEWRKQGYTMRHIDMAGASRPNKHNEFLYSPNVPYILRPATPTCHPSKIRIYSDGMMGHDEITRWPRILTLPSEAHLACVPLSPVFRDNYSYDPFPFPLHKFDWKRVAPLWALLEMPDFHRHSGNSMFDDKIPRFTMPKSMVKQFVDTLEYIKELVNTIPSSCYRNIDRYNQVMVSIEAYLTRLDNILMLMDCAVPEKFAIAIMRARDVQRLMLEILGHLILQVVVDPRYTTNKVPPAEVMPLLGCVATSPWDVVWLLKCGVPVWKTSHTLYLKSDTLRVFNNGQDYVDITELLSLTDFEEEDPATGMRIRRPVYQEDLDERARKAPKRGLIQAAAVTSFPVILLPRFRDLSVPRHQEEALLGQMVQYLHNSKTPQPLHYPFDHVVVSSADSPQSLDSEAPLLTQIQTIDFHSIPLSPSPRLPQTMLLRQSTHKLKRQPPNKSLFGDLFAKIFVHDKSVLFQPFLSAVGRLGHKKAPWSEVPAALFIFPPPSVFMKDKAERAERIVRWLRIRNRWAGSVFNGQMPAVEPQQTAVWRALLTADKRVDSKRRPTSSSRAQKKSEGRDKAIEKAHRLRSMFPSSAVLSASWAGKLFVDNEMAWYPDIKNEVFYELHHLNFVADFFSLDAEEMESMGVDLSDRRRRFLSTFGGQTLLDLDDIKFPDHWASDINERFQQLQTWYLLMQDWPHCPPQLQTELSSISHDDILAFEQNMINLYVTLFALRFFRWPVVPMICPLSLARKYTLQTDSNHP